MSQLNDKADSDGLRRLARDLDRRSSQSDRHLATLSRAIADFRSDRLPACAERLDSLHRVSESLDPRLHAVMRRFRAGIRKYMGDRPAGMKEIMVGLSVADSVKQARERVELLVMRAEFLLEENFQSEALVALESAQRLAERAHYRRGRCMVRLNMGNLHYYQQRFDDAWNDYESALQIATEGGFDRLAESCIGNLGAVAAETNRLPLALQLFDGLLARVSSSRTALRAMLLGQTAYIRAQLGESDKALGLYQKSIAISDSLGDRRTAADTRQYMAKTLWAIGRQSEAVESMRQALQGLVAERDVHMQAVARRALWQWYETMGEKDRALYEARTVRQLDDSLNLARYNDRLALAEISFETERKEHQIAAQQQELALAAAEDRRKKLQRNLSMTIAAAFVLVALLLWRGLRARGRLAEQERELHRNEVDQLMNESENKALHAMLDGQEKERNRVARELHDRVGSMLGALKMQVGALETRLESKNLGEDAQAAKVNRLLDETVGEVRRLSHDMRTSNLSRFGLAQALEDICASVRVAGKLDVELVMNGLDQRLEQEAEIAIYRIVQELISNALKHARPRKLSISITRSMGRINVSVADDGIGFDIAKARKGMGLENVEARAASIGGNVHWKSEPGNGTTVNVDCPLKED